MSVCVTVCLSVAVAHESCTETPKPFVVKILGPRKSITGCSIVTPSLIQDGGLSLIWKSLCRHISVKNVPIMMKSGTHFWFPTGHFLFASSYSFFGKTHRLATIHTLQTTDRRDSMGGATAIPTVAVLANLGQPHRYGVRSSRFTSKLVT